MKDGKEKLKKENIANRSLTEDDVYSAIRNGSPITSEMREIMKQREIEEFISSVIPARIFRLSEEQHKKTKKPDADLKSKFLQLIYSKEDTASMRERLISTMAGMVGHVWAAKYFEEKQGYDVENEFEIHDKKGHLITASDMVLTKNGHKTYVEMKTIKALISDERDYPTGEIVSGERIPREKYEVKRDPLERIAVKTGQKAGEQVQKTREYLDEKGDTDSETALCIYQGVTMSESIRENVEKNGRIIVLPLEVDRIFEYASDLVDTIMYKGRNILYPIKGQEERTVITPDLEL